MNIPTIHTRAHYLVIGCMLWFTQNFLWVGPVFSDPFPDSTRRALLIGIGKYQELPRLPGSKNDIHLVHQVLQSRYGFPEKNIRIVRDEEATRENVLLALTQFVSEVGSRDIAYIHYSGHGSQVEDVSGDETGDELDETIVPYDGRTEGIPDITDDELEEILSNLKTETAIVVLDSCHSGTATRGLEVRVRSIPRDMRVALYKQSMVRTRAIVPLASARYVLMSGAASHEEALDGPVDGRYHGFFTHSLFKSLQLADPAASASEVFAGAKQELKRIQHQFGRSSMPEPQLEAPESRLGQPLFKHHRSVAQTVNSAQAEETRRPWVSLMNQDKGKVVLLNAVALGGAVGSVWGIYPNGETGFNPGQAKAFARIVSIQGRHSLANVEPHGISIPRGARAALLVSAPPSGGIPIRLRSVDQADQEWLQEALQQRLGEVEIVGDGAFARFVVDVKGKSLHVYSADAVKEIAALPASRTANSVDWLAQMLTQSRNASSLLAMENPASRMKLDVRVVQVSDRGIAVVSDRMEAPAYRIRRAGSPRTLTNSLQLEISTDTDSYITIMDVDAEGMVNILFPNPYIKEGFYPDGFVRANRSVLIPDSLRSGNRAGFHFDYANPAGVDTIRVFATTDRRLAERIRQSVQPRRPGSIKTQEPLTQLTSLRQELVGSLTRGLITVPDEPTSQASQAPIQPNTSMMIQGQEFVEADQEHYDEVSMGEAERESGAGHNDFQAIPVQKHISDWTAASVTVLVGE